MSTNEFDKLLNEKFDRHEFPYNHAAWEQLARQLPQKDDNRKVVVFAWTKITGIAAALAITISGVAWYYHQEKTQHQAIAGNQPVQNTIDHKSADPEEKETMFEEVKAQADLPKSGNSNHPLPAYTAHQQEIVTPDNQKIIPANNNNTQAALANNNEKVDAYELVNNEVLSVQKEELPVKSEVVRMNQELNNSYSFEPVNKPSSATLFSLTGGMNYGSMNTGYMAGVNAKQKINNKMFIEGDLAFVNNKASRSFTQQQQQAAVLNKAPIDYKDAQLMYIQLNPTLGYQIWKGVSVGVGADVQKLVNDDHTLVSVNDEVKTIPGTDVGLTGKTEVSISRRLKAGILYREGINNLLQSSNDLFDRRYLQVQLKFVVTGN